MKSSQKLTLTGWLSRPSSRAKSSTDELMEFFDLPPFAEDRINQLSENDLALIEGLRVQSEREPLNEDACAPGTLVWSVRLRHTRMVMEMLGYSTLEVNQHCSSLNIKHKVPALTLP